MSPLQAVPDQAPWANAGQQDALLRAFCPRSSELLFVWTLAQDLFVIGDPTRETSPGQHSSWDDWDMQTPPQ